jgi:hypothetical protein
MEKLWIRLNKFFSQYKLNHSNSLKEILVSQNPPLDPRFQRGSRGKPHPTLQIVK